MATRNQVLTLARSQVGYTEGTGYGGRSNYTKYWRDLKPNYQGQPWCAAFVNWCLIKSGSHLLFDGPSAWAYTPSMEAWAKKTGRWKASKDCKPGDVLIFGNGHATHTGFLRAQDGPNYVLTIEGNTSSGSGGSQTNGGGVYLRRRPRSWVRGCIDLSSEFSGRPTAPAPAKVGGKYLVVDGRRDAATVKVLQEWLNATRKAGQPALVVDGDDGPATIKQFQWKIGARQDGDFGPDSARKAEKWLGIPATTIPGWHPGIVRGVQRELNAWIKGGKKANR